MARRPSQPDIINKLRSEYDDYYPKAEKLIGYAKRIIAGLLNKKILSLKDFERIEISGRIKTFQSCRAKLAIDLNYTPENKSIFSLKDLVGIKIATFPNYHIPKIC